MNEGFQKTITKGIKFLAKEQEKDGSFFCLVSTKLDDYKNANTVPAIVPANIVLSSLINISGSETARRIKQKAAKFLLGEKGGYWSFNYWFKKSNWYKKEPYPDDTDDTFCALAALYEYKPELFDGEAMARIVTMLTSAEEKEGGPYDMWLVPPSGREKWRDIDLVCNSNIAYFLSLQDIHLPKLDAFIDKSIQEKDYEFPYNKIYPGIYFISRFYRGKKAKQIISLLLENQESGGKWENPLRTALAVSSLINLEGFQHFKQIEKGIEYLVKTQGQDGGWEPYSFYFQMRKKEKTLYAGSPFITTALCLEAINKYNKISNFQFSIFKQITNSKLLKKEETIYNKIIKSYQQRFSGFSRDFQEKATMMADKILKKNKDVVLLPYYFAHSLRKNLSSKFNPPAGGHNSDLLIRLGEANLCGWIAYTIYDDFLDEEGDPKELPLANMCLRESAEIFSNILPENCGFTAFSKKIFDTIDGANMWEATHCRKSEIRNPKSETNPSADRQDSKFQTCLPTGKIQNSKLRIPNYENYSQLADKSLGHALGPMAILFALGYKANSAEVRNTMSFFKNYIIARQLNDDAHDWEDDLKKGHVSAVGARLLSDGGGSAFGGKDTKSNKRNLETLRQIFWHKTIAGVCKDILRRANLARNDLKKISIAEEPTVFSGMLAAIEQSAEKTLKEREETIKFLKAYASR